ncbi:hypothetical protein CYMTET_5012 [Cymbomonas tetramitiformis]|uniref:Isochorismatase-like domain-containing protein n=1 Tax=Cymbomonas tetramitiformis TaxID=36881 RepID=A0AAE0LJB7_9CHLO|nr:hypothetical protein CYMTET_5012 [Cymbomonas tetramitiformis]
MSVEQVSGISYRKEETVNTIVDLVHSANQHGVFDLVVDSHLWIQYDSETTIRKVFDGGHVNDPKAGLIPQLSVLNTTFVVKKQFSCFYSTYLEDVLRHYGIEEVYLSGINTNYCVFATALDAFYRNFGMYVVEDAVTSVDGKEGHEAGLHMLRSFFNAPGYTDVIVNSSSLLTPHQRQPPASRGINI